jgi:hypothetical protein
MAPSPAVQYQPPSVLTRFLRERRDGCALRIFALPTPTKRLVQRHEIGGDRRRVLRKVLFCGQQAPLCDEHLQEGPYTGGIASLREIQSSLVFLYRKPELFVALLLRGVRDQGVVDFVPGGEHGALESDRCLLLLRLAQG